MMESHVRTQVVCSKCGQTTSVPFAPTPGRPVFCRECFSKQTPRSSEPRGAPRGPSKPNQMPRKRMMAQGRKGHFVHDARGVLVRMEGGMDDQHVRAFLEGLFARGARTSTQAAQEFLDEKLADETITTDQRRALGDLVERYSFYR
jgi:CxxC-x17-CxxC domain-containing protein